MSNFVLSQVLTGIAICTDVLSFQFKERTKIVACLVVSASLISAHFMLLNHWTAASLGMLAAARFATSLFTTSKKLMGLFIVASIAVSVFSFAGLLSILGCSAAIFYYCCLFLQGGQTPQRANAGRYDNLDCA